MKFSKKVPYQYENEDEIAVIPQDPYAFGDQMGYERGFIRFGRDVYKVTHEKYLTAANGESLQIVFFRSDNKQSFYMRSDDTMAVIKGFNDLKQAEDCINRRINQPDWLDLSPKERELHTEYTIYRKTESLSARTHQQENARIH